MRKLTIQNGKIAVCNIRKIVLLLLILLAPMFASAQTKQYYLYNIVTFEGDFDKEGVKVKVDDGKTVEKLKDGKGNRIKFNTPAAALMYFLSEGWDMYLTGVHLLAVVIVAQVSVILQPTGYLESLALRRNLIKQ